MATKTHCAEAKFCEFTRIGEEEGLVVLVGRKVIPVMKSKAKQFIWFDFGKGECFILTLFLLFYTGCLTNMAFSSQVGV